MFFGDLVIGNWQFVIGSLQLAICNWPWAIGRLSGPKFDNDVEAI